MGLDGLSWSRYKERDSKKVNEAMNIRFLKKREKTEEEMD